MQILLGAEETIIKINSHSVRIDYIQHFISTHFLNRTIKDNVIYIPKSKDASYHRAFLLKWLYTFYVKKTNNNLPELKELLIDRQKKAIKILLQEKIIHRIVYSVIDKENIKIQISPSNNQIVRSIKTFLQTDIKLFATHIIITISEQKQKELLEKLLCSKKLINIPYKHIYSKEEMQTFIEAKKEEKTKETYTQIYQNNLDDAHLILGSFPHDDVKTLKKRYKKLAKMLHPDKINIEDKSSQILYTKKFQNLNNAYEFLLYNAV